MPRRAHGDGDALGPPPVGPAVSEPDFQWFFHGQVIRLSFAPAVVCCGDDHLGCLRHTRDLILAEGTRL